MRSEASGNTAPDASTICAMSTTGSTVMACSLVRAAAEIKRPRHIPANAATATSTVSSRRPDPSATASLGPCWAAVAMSTYTMICKIVMAPSTTTFDAR